MKAKVLAAVFGVFILLVILSADLGLMPSLVRAMYDFPHGDRVGHVVLYGILATLVAVALPRAIALGRLLVPVSLIILFVFVTVEECSQSLFPTRTADFVDLACSYFGIFLGGVAAQRWKARVEKPNS